MGEQNQIYTKYLIVGAGISGLSFANFLDENDKDYVIIEKENEVGGFCRTIKKGEYIWDYAGHFFHFKTNEFKKMFVDSVGEDKIIYKNKNTKIYYNNKLIDYPFQTNIHQLEKNEFIDCLYDLFNKEEKENYENFLDMLYGKFGKAIVEKFLRPYNEKLYACDLTKLDTEAMGRFFPYANITQIIDNMKNSSNKSYNSTFLYPVNGASYFIDKLYNNLDKEKVLLQTEVTSINMDSKTATLNTGTCIKYEYLINTSPFNKFLQILDKNYTDLIKSLSFNKVLVFNLGFEKKSKFDEHWIYIPDKDINFYRIGFYDNILDSDKLSMYVEIGFKENDNIDIKKQLQLTIENLEKMGIVNDNKLVEWTSIIMDPAYVHISEESNKKIHRTMEEFKEKKIYSIGRYGAWTYCSMEDCMIEAQKLVNKLGGKNESFINSGTNL